MMSRVTASLISLLLLSTAFANDPKDGEEQGMFKQKPIYVSMLPHFLVNLADGESKRFMQIKANTLVP